MASSPTATRSFNSERSTVGTRIGSRSGLILSFLALLVPSTLCWGDAPGIAGKPPFPVGERLTYSLSWGAIAAGTALMEVAAREPLGSRFVLRLLHTARSNDFVSVFYPVNNRVESFLDEESMLPARLILKRREGKRKNDIDVIFDQTARRATVTKDGQTETLEVPPHVQDTLSCLYFFRALSTFQPGQSIGIDVHHDKKNYHLELKVEGLERIKGPLGEFETVRVLAIMPFRGLFLNEGNIRVWFTNDAARIPVLMRAKVIIGSISATLTGVEGATLGGRVITGRPMEKSITNEGHANTSGTKSALPLQKDVDIMSPLLKPSS
jgi:hypothetical protein